MLGHNDLSPLSALVTERQQDSEGVQVNAETLQATIVKIGGALSTDATPPVSVIAIEPVERPVGPFMMAVSSDTMELALRRGHDHVVLTLVDRFEFDEVHAVRIDGEA
ncbi:hypothetical protein BH10PSE3_BH10PSE3_09240 [soil metagenome]